MQCTDSEMYITVALIFHTLKDFFKWTKFSIIVFLFIHYVYSKRFFLNICLSNINLKISFSSNKLKTIMTNQLLMFMLSRINIPEGFHWIEPKKWGHLISKKGDICRVWTKENINPQNLYLLHFIVTTNWQNRHPQARIIIFLLLNIKRLLYSLKYNLVIFHSLLYWDVNTKFQSK